MKKNIISILCCFSMLASSCNYLNMVPEKDIETIETIFESRQGAESWWTGLYSVYNGNRGSIHINAANLGADEYIANHLLHNYKLGLPALLIAKGQQMSQDPHCPIWGRMYQIIRNSNTFLENIHRTHNLPEAERKWWIADVKALKANIYFELMRHYGPICIIPQNLPVDLEVEAYQLPRQHVDECFKEILSLLDEAKSDIPMHSARSASYGHTITLEALYALKAKILLYAASPLFNGNIHYSDFTNKNGEVLFNSTYDHNKWLLAAEAADKAVEICAEGDRKLYKGDGGKSSVLLNYMSDIEHSVFSRFDNPEFLIEMKHVGNTWQIATLPCLVGDDASYDSNLLGSLSPSMKMVEMYYTENGLPIDADDTWSYSNRHKIGSESSYLYEGVIPLNTEVVNLHLRREPRFYASIAGDRMYFQRGTNSLGIDYNLLVKAHKGEEPWGTVEDIIVSNTKQNITGYWLKKHLISSYTTKGYNGFLDGKETMPIIRLSELFLMQSEAWNEYLDVPNNKVWDPIDKVRKRAGIPSVKESWTNYSSQKDKILTRIGMRDIIRDEYNIELAFEGHRYWNIRRWLIADEVMNERQLCWNILGNDFQSFYNNGDGPNYEINDHKFISPRDYLTPISAEQIQVSGMKNNPGW